MHFGAILRLSASFQLLIVLCIQTRDRFGANISTSAFLPLFPPVSTSTQPQARLHAFRMARPAAKLLAVCVPRHKCGRSDHTRRAVYQLLLVSCFAFDVSTSLSSVSPRSFAFFFKTLARTVG